MNEHPQFDEDFDLYALGALDPAEKATIESHLAGCTECAAKAAAARERIAMLALAVPAMTPPAGAKERLMERVRAERMPHGEAPRAEASRPGAPRRTAFWLRPSVAWGMAAILAVVALILAVDNSRLKQQAAAYDAAMQSQRAANARAEAVLDLLTAPDTQGVTLTVASEKPRTEGRVYYHPNRGLIFYAEGLSAPPENRVYQLWLVPSQGAPISAGIFAPDQKGNASIVLPNLPAGVTAKAFAVTVEPKGGVPQPTGPKILVGAA
jgi:anti-sigma-K factor RskA